jgi:hypothetical protein
MEILVIALINTMRMVLNVRNVIILALNVMERVKKAVLIVLMEELRLMDYVFVIMTMAGSIILKPIAAIL